MVFSGWAAIYTLCKNSNLVPREDAIADLVAAYLGVMYPHSHHSALANVREAPYILFTILRI